MESYPFEKAVEFNNVPVARLLLELGADVNCPQEVEKDYNLKPILQAIKNQNFEMVELLCQQPFIQLDMPGSSVTTLTLAIESKNLPITQILVNKGANVNLPHPKNNRSPLAIALLSKQIEIAKFLATNGASIETAKVDLNNLMKKLIISAIENEISLIKVFNLKKSTITTKISQLREIYQGAVTDQEWAKLAAPKSLSGDDIFGYNAVDPDLMMRKMSCIDLIVQCRKALNVIAKEEMRARKDESLTNFSRLEKFIETIADSIMSPPNKNMLLLNQDAKMELVCVFNKDNVSFDEIKAGLIRYIAAVDGFFNKTDKNHLRTTLSAYLTINLDTNMGKRIANITIDSLPDPAPFALVESSLDSLRVAPNSSMFGNISSSTVSPHVSKELDDVGIKVFSPGGHV